MLFGFDISLYEYPQTQAAWAEILARRKEVRFLRAAVASLSCDAAALRTAASAAAPAPGAPDSQHDDPFDQGPLQGEASMMEVLVGGGDEGKQLLLSRSATASPSAWAAGSVGAVDVDAFASAVVPPKPAATVAADSITPTMTTTNQAAGGADLNSFLDSLLTDGWSEERGALMDAGAAH